MKQELEVTNEIPANPTFGYLTFLTSPRKFFDQLMESPRFLFPLLFFILANICFAYAILPTVTRELSQNSPDLELTESTKHLFNFFAILSSVIMSLLTFACTCLGFYFIGTLFKSDLRMRYVVSALAFVQVPKSLKVLLLSTWIFTTEVVPKNKGLSGVIPTDIPLLKAFLEHIDLFNIWYLLLLALAIHSLFKAPLKKAFLLVVAFFLVDVIIQVLIRAATTNV